MNWNRFSPGGLCVVMLLVGLVSVDRAAGQQPAGNLQFACPGDASHTKNAVRACRFFSFTGPSSRICCARSRLNWPHQGTGLSVFTGEGTGTVRRLETRGATTGRGRCGRTAQISGHCPRTRRRPASRADQLVFRTAAIDQSGRCLDYALTRRG
jgi:hypothetical protein